MKDQSIIQHLFKGVHPASLGVFRMVFGLIMFLQVVFIKPYILHVLPKSKFFLKYDLFDWVALLPGGWMSFVLIFMMVAAAAVTLGVLYRPACILLTIGWGYIFFLDQGHYNNHYYLFLLVSVYMCTTQADKWGSLRSIWDKKYCQGTIPYWQVLIPQILIFIVYFYGGIAKLNPDWLAAKEMQLWLPNRVQNYYINGFLSSLGGAYFMAYAGLLFDLSIGFLLFWRKTRTWALIPLLLFHIGNHFLWDIGLFPYSMMGFTIIFFDPDLAQRVINKIRKIPPPKLVSFSHPIEVKQKLILGFLGIFLVFQLLFPFRRYLYSGNTSWHGKGHLFSWRMMMGDQLDQIRVSFETPDMGRQYVSIFDYMSQRQLMKGSRTPVQYMHFAHALGDSLQAGGLENPVVKMEVYKSVNGRPWQLLIDSTANLAAEEHHYFRKPDWILPMED